MKKIALPVVSLVTITAGLTACGQDTASSNASSASAKASPTAAAEVSLDLGGVGARELYTALKLPEAKVAISIPGGINPLAGSKSFETSDGSLSLFCERRMLSTSCEVVAVSTLAALSTSAGGSTLSLAGSAAAGLYEILNVAEKKAIVGRPGGINPLVGSKSFESSDGSLLVSCEKRMLSTSCSVETVVAVTPTPVKR